MTFPNGPAAAALGARKLGASKADTALVGQLQERCGGELKKGVLHASHGEARFRVRILPKGQGFLVSVVCHPAGRFHVTRKSGLDRWMEGFVPALQLKTRDTRFDRDFNVRTRDLRLTSDLLTRPPNLAALRALFDRGVQVVHLDGNRIKTTITRRALGAQPAAEDILALVEQLAVITGAIATIATGGSYRPAPKHDPALVISWTSLGVLGLLGFVMVLAGAIEYTPVLPSRFLVPCALFGLPTIAPVIFALALAVQHRTSPYALLRGLALLACFVVPLFVSGSLLLTNGMLDDSPAEEHVVPVLGKSARKNKNEMKYSAGLASWWTEGDTRWLQVSRQTYDRITPNESHMRVQAHAGRLGHEWIESYALEE